MRLARTRLVWASVAVGALALAAPAPALAASPTALGLLGVDVGDIAGEVVEAAIGVLFGDLASSLGESTLRLLLIYPDFTEEGQFGHLQAAVSQTAPVAAGLLCLCTLMGFLHGLATHGADGGLDAGKRFVGAFVGIWAWGWLYSTGIEGANTLFGAMVELPLVGRSVGQGIEIALTGASTPFGALLGAVVGCVVLVLLCTKIAATALLSIAFVAGPFALAAFPYPPLSHLTGALFQTLGAVLALPLLWSVMVIVFAATGKGALMLEGADVDDALIGPLVALTLLVMMVLSLPFLLKRGHVAGLLPSLHGAASTAHYTRALAGSLGASEIAGRSSAQMTEAAAPPTRTAAATDSTMAPDFGAPPTSPGASSGTVGSAPATTGATAVTAGGGGPVAGARSADAPHAPAPPAGQRGTARMAPGGRDDAGWPDDGLPVAGAIGRDGGMPGAQPVVAGADAGPVQAPGMPSASHVARRPAVSDGAGTSVEPPGDSAAPDVIGATADHRGVAPGVAGDTHTPDGAASATVTGDGVASAGLPAAAPDSPADLPRLHDTAGAGLAPVDESDPPTLGEER